MDNGLLNKFGVNLLSSPVQNFVASPGSKRTIQ